MLIGLGFSAQVGKDTVGDYLVRQYNFHKRAFADPLKNAVREIFGFNQDQLYGAYKEINDPFWGVSPREVMQKLGTDGCRALFGDDIWIKALLRQLDPKLDTVVVDVRFPNEGKAIKSAGGILINVIRPNGIPGTKHVHVSESAMANFTDWDATFNNSGSFADLYAQIDKFIATSLVPNRGY
jgi:hypothetical protein